MAAVTHSDLAWIETNIFGLSCAFSGCHSSATDLGKLDLRVGMSHNDLVGVASIADPTRILVVPNDIHASYLMLSLHDFPPETATLPGWRPPSATCRKAHLGAPSTTYQTLTRHFQTWRRAKKFWTGQYTGSQSHDPGLTYDRERITVAVRVLPAAQALAEEARLIARLRPRDNLLGQPVDDAQEEAIPF